MEIGITRCIIVSMDEKWQSYFLTDVILCMFGQESAAAVLSQEDLFIAALPYSRLGQWIRSVHDIISSHLGITAFIHCISH